MVKNAILVILAMSSCVFSSLPGQCCLNSRITFKPISNEFERGKGIQNKK